MYKTKAKLMEQLRAKVAAGELSKRLVRTYDFIEDTVVDDGGERSGVRKVLDGGL